MGMHSDKTSSLLHEPCAVVDELRLFAFCGPTSHDAILSLCYNQTCKNDFDTLSLRCRSPQVTRRRETSLDMPTLIHVYDPILSFTIIPVLNSRRLLWERVTNTFELATILWASEQKQQKSHDDEVLCSSAPASLQHISVQCRVVTAKSIKGGPCLRKNALRRRRSMHC